METSRKLDFVTARTIFHNTYSFFNKISFGEVLIDTKVTGLQYGYKKAVILKNEEYSYAISVGIAFQKKEDNIYTDISSVKIFSSFKSVIEIKDEVTHHLQNGGFGQNSMIFSKGDGSIGLNDTNQFSKTLFPLIQKKIHLFLEEPNLTDVFFSAKENRLINSEKEVRYRKHFSFFLFNTLHFALFNEHCK